MSGKVGQRWMGYARWWWLNNRGPIPSGLRVLHADGDTLNDDPSNYVLGTAADNIKICHRADPEMAARNRAAMSAGTIAMNKRRALVRRIRHWLPTQWYPVDHVKKEIHNKPVDCRYKVWPAIGVDVRISANGALCDSSALGWPDRRFSEACIMAALADGRLDAATLFARVNRLRVERGEPAFKEMKCLYQWTSPLGQLGLITRESRHRRGSFYELTEAGRESRGPWTPVVPVRGRDLSTAFYRGYRRAGEPIVKQSNSTLAGRLRSAIAALDLVERVVLKLTVFPRMTWTLEELAVLLRTNKLAVASAQRRAIDKIRTTLVEDAA